MHLLPAELSSSPNAALAGIMLSLNSVVRLHLDQLDLHRAFTPLLEHVNQSLLAFGGVRRVFA